MFIFIQRLKSLKADEIITKKIKNEPNKYIEFESLKPILLKKFDIKLSLIFFSSLSNKDKNGRIK